MYIKRITTSTKNTIIKENYTSIAKIDINGNISVTLQWKKHIKGLIIALNFRKNELEEAIHEGTITLIKL